MSTKTPSTDDILRPIHNTTKKYWILYGVAMVAFLAFIGLWAIQLQKGLIVTGLSDWGSGGGSNWGLYIGAFIWWVGIAHGGIILSAAVRLLGMDRYMPVARLAEMLTLAGLSAAGFYIIVHMGRPDRMVRSIITHYHVTVNNSPLVWDVTVITAYFVLTATYLALTIRYDVNRLRDDLPDIFEPVYKAITIGYTKAEDEIIERMVWWIAAAIIIMAPLLLHGGVIPWLFAQIPTMPGWFGAIQGPTFLTIALMSAISGVIIICYVFRWAYDWEHIFSDDIFRGLLLWLGFFILIFTWMQIQQIVNGVFNAPLAQETAMDAKLHTNLYLIAMAGIFGSLMYIFAQGLRPSLFSRERAVAVGLVILSMTLLEKTLFVIEGLMYPMMNIYDAVPGAYTPSLVELMSVVGTTAMVVLFFLNLAKVVPVVELHYVEHAQGGHGHDDEHEPTAESAQQPEVEA